MNTFDRQVAYWAHMLDDTQHKESKKEVVSESKKEVILERKMTREEYDDLQQKLRTGVVKFKFKKKDGTTRDAVGTLNPALMPSEEDQRAQYEQLRQADPTNTQTYDEMLRMFDDRKGYMIYFWDLEKNAYRQFHVSRFEGIESFRPTNNAADVQNIGNNTFVYTDRQSLDAFMTPDNLERIDNGLEQQFPSGVSVKINGQSIAGSGVLAVTYDRATGTPTLIYAVHLEQDIDDFNIAPIELGINEVRKYIFDTYGVKIAKVKIQSEVSYT